MNEAPTAELFEAGGEHDAGPAALGSQNLQDNPDLPDGVALWRGLLQPVDQRAVLALLRDAVASAPLFTPKMPRTGKPMSVRMTNMGDLGWVSDQERGYRYQATHPVTKNPWPPIPPVLLDLWRECAPGAPPPQACLINHYTADARMGLHQDRDEEALDVPVLSVSLGDTCLFRVGGNQRGGKTRSFKLHSGDVMMLSGPARLAFHGVDRLYPGTSDLLKGGGRINLTLRRVTAD